MRRPVSLASRREPTGMSKRNAKVFMGIHRGVVDANFIVKVRAGATAAQANVSDRIAAMDVLTRGDGEAGEMAISCGDSVSVIENDGASVAPTEISEFDNAIGWRDHRLTDGGGDIYAAVECSFTIERVNPFAK